MTIVFYKANYVSDLDKYLNVDFYAVFVQFRPKKSPINWTFSETYI